MAGNVVWRRYKVTNPDVAAAMQQTFPYPFAFRNSNGTAAALTMAPMCNVLWSASGSPPYNQSTIGCVIDPVAGTITTVSPTSLVYGGGAVTPPSDVQVFVPVATGSLETIFPVSGYGGTLYSVEGIQRTKMVTCRDWTDYSLTTQMAAVRGGAFRQPLRRGRRGDHRLPRAWPQPTSRRARPSRSRGTATRPATNRSRTTAATTESRSRASRSSSIPGPGARPTSARCTCRIASSGTRPRSTSGRRRGGSGSADPLVPATARQ